MCFMAHHLGMSLIACDNLLNDQIMQKRFMSDAEMDAFSELLQERTPVDAVMVRASFSEVPEKPKRLAESEWSLALAGFDAFRPRCHLLSNGSYSIFMTNTGLSASVSDGIALNRFDGMLTEGVCGIYFFFRTKKAMYSLTPAPFFDRNLQYSAEFEEKGAKLYASFDGMRTCVTVCVPNRDKAELREIKLKSSSAIEGELICYFEPILAKPEEYRSHPAFSKLFLETESRNNGILVRRRPRRRGPPLPVLYQFRRLRKLFNLKGESAWQRRFRCHTKADGQALAVNRRAGHRSVHHNQDPDKDQGGRK